MNRSIDHHIEEYLAHLAVERNLSPRTLESYARDLRQYEAADMHLTRALDALHDKGRRAQCLHWLRDVRGALGRSAPEE